QGVQVALERDFRADFAAGRRAGASSAEGRAARFAAAVRGLRAVVRTCASPSSRATEACSAAMRSFMAAISVLARALLHVAGERGHARGDVAEALFRGRLRLALNRDAFLHQGLEDL